MTARKQAEKKPQVKKNQEEEQVQKKPVQSKPEVVEINADGQILGRISTKIADVLRGKDNPNFRPNLIMGKKVVVINASKIKVTGNKMEDKEYHHHTGYLGHLKTVTLKDLMKKDPADVIKRAVYGMLPKNKLRNTWMKNLTVKNGE